MNFDKLREELFTEKPVANRTAQRANTSYMKNSQKRFATIKKNLKEAKKTKDVDKLKQASEELDKLIDEIEDYRQHIVKYDDYKDSYKLARDTNKVVDILKVLIFAIPISAAVKAGFKELTHINTDELEKDPIGTAGKTVSNVSNSYDKSARNLKPISTLAAGAVAGATAYSYGRGYKKSYSKIMTDMEKLIKKLRAYNKTIKAEIQKMSKDISKIKTNAVSESAVCKLMDMRKSGRIDNSELVTMLEFVSMNNPAPVDNCNWSNPVFMAIEQVIDDEMDPGSIDTIIEALG